MTARKRKDSRRAGVNERVKERWVNAVVDIRIPLDISPDASREEQLEAAVAKVEELDIYSAEGFSVGTEIVVDGEPVDEEGHAVLIARREVAKLIDWHERRAKVKRLNAEQESDPTSRATLLGNADTHDVAASVVRRVLEGKSLEGSR